VLRELGYKCGIKTVVRKGNGNVCLSTAVYYAKLVSLGKAEISLGSEAEHDFAKGYNFHYFKFLSKILII
jgi:hypothetical protein